MLQAKQAKISDSEIAGLFQKGLNLGKNVVTCLLLLATMLYTSELCNYQCSTICVVYRGEIMPLRNWNWRKTILCSIILQFIYKSQFNSALNNFNLFFIWCGPHLRSHMYLCHLETEGNVAGKLSVILYLKTRVTTLQNWGQHTHLYCIWEISFQCSCIVDIQAMNDIYTQISWFFYIVSKSYLRRGPYRFFLYQQG